MDIPAFLTAAEAYPPPANADGTQMRFSYGTAGFRTVGTTLRSTVFRCGALAAIRSRVTGRACGIVITASHNPEADNGVKLVDCTGGMLPTTWEADAEALANAPDAEAMRAVVQKLLATDEPAENLHPPPPAGLAADPPAPHVFLARDTRPTGPELAAAARAGAAAAGAAVTDLGLSTTPQGHFAVYAAYRGWPRTEADYYARLARGYATLTRSESHEKMDEDCIFVDCANGVGASKFARLVDATRAAGAPLRVALRNDATHETRPGSLNQDVGADYVQKERRFPAHGGFDELPTGTKCVSVDGDADRLVYFYRDASSNETRLLDGDKIASLIATRVGDLTRRCGDDLRRSLRVGVVQTAYANGASTRYIETALGLETTCVPTGVKHLHPAAETFDVGVYFEANGHGTALFSDDALARVAAVAADETGTTEDARRAAASLLALAETINPAVGDALSGVLVVEATLLAKRWRLEDWDAMYADAPSKQVKVRVRDRGVIVTADAERRAVRPEGMQAAIDAAVVACGEDSAARAFARPSGTEDVVRVYAEGRTREIADALAREVAKIVHAHAGGVGDEP